MSDQDDQEPMLAGPEENKQQEPTRRGDQLLKKLREIEESRAKMTPEELLDVRKKELKAVDYLLNNICGSTPRE